MMMKVPRERARSWLWLRGDTVSATHWIEAMERVWSHPDVPARLQLNRDDIGFAHEKIMAWHEMAGVPRPRYLFKMKLMANVRRAIAQMPWPEWDGQPRAGLEQYAQTRVKLEGWSCEFRIFPAAVFNHQGHEGIRSSAILEHPESIGGLA